MQVMEEKKRDHVQREKNLQKVQRMLEIVRPESESVINLDDAYVLVESINQKYLNKPLGLGNRWD